MENTAAVPQDVGQALGGLMSTVKFLADVDAAELTSAERAETLYVLLHADAVLGVARSG
jgi:hypothetical protein